MGSFRLAASYQNHTDKSVRPPLAPWLTEDRSQWPLCKNTSWRYYIKLYWATPPWLSEAQREEMRLMYENCPEGYHVDHIVPLKNATMVRGLHVPWNLQYLLAGPNMSKGSRYWPDMPFEQGELF